MTRFLQDLRFALRMLAKRPLFSALIIASLGLGIGANTAIFSAINAVMVRMLPVREPQQLKMVAWTISTSDFPESYIEDLEGDFGRRSGTNFGSYSASYPAYERISAENHSFSDTFAFSANDQQVNFESGGHSGNALLQAISGNFCSGMGLTPAAGRSLLSSDDAATAAPAIMISHRLWQSQFGGEASALGAMVHVNGKPMTVVGVMPSEFFGVNPGSAPDLWVPLHWYAAQSALLEGQNPDTFLVDRRIWWVGIIGRLKPGVSEAAASSEISALFQRTLQLDDSRSTPGKTAEYAGSGPAGEYSPQAAQRQVPSASLVPVARGLDNLRREFSTPLWVLMGMVGLVLLITCANVAALLLTRATARQKELAVRLSLGATPALVVRQILTETILLSLCGGIFGLLFAHAVSILLLRLLSSGRFPLDLTLSPDPYVLAFAAAISILSGILFGLAPAWRASRVQPLAVIKQSGSGSATAARQVSGKLLVAAQIALSFTLLAGCGLFLRTLQNLQHVDLGYNRELLMRFTVRPGLNGYSDSQLVAYYQRLQSELGATPGVRSVAFSMHAPVDGGTAITVGKVPGYTDEGKRIQIYRHDVSARYFETLSIPIVLGRGIEARDQRQATHVAVVNQAFIKQYLRGDSPLGHRIDLGSAKDPQPYEIVGVARDVKYADLRTDVPPTAYFSFLQRKTAPPFMTFEVRGHLPESQLLPLLQRTVLSLDARVPAVEVKTETEAVGEVLSLERTFATLSSAFGLLAVTLAAIGLYGTVSYAVAMRTNEIGIRMALGADRSAVTRMVLREVFSVVFLGLLTGIPAVWILSNVLRAQLFGLSPHDGGSLIFAVLLILSISLFAGSVPARRAARVEPVEALRYE